MKLSIKGVALAAGILWALAVLITAAANMIWTGYASMFLAMLASIYPGYDPVAGFVPVIVVTLYALVDGIIGGAIFAWLYNLFAA